jgi:hypothetical protein
MLARFRSHFRQQFVGYIALFLAVGGGGVAVASHLRVNTSDIVDQAVRNAKLGDNSVNGAKVKNESLTGQDLDKDSVGSPRITDGSLSSADIAPNSIASGRILDNTLTGADIRESTLSGVRLSGREWRIASSAKNSNSPKTASATCSTGKQVVGMGYDVSGGVSGNAPNATLDVVVNFVDSIYEQTATGVAYETDPTSDDWSVRVTAICANVE